MKGAARRQIYLSSESKGGMTQQLGEIHYSYVFAEDGFKRALLSLNYEPNILGMPEIYNDLSALPRPCGAEISPVHISFRSTENIRLCRPAYNISAFAWEFTVMRQHTLFGDHPFDNQIHMLSLMDEVWAPSRFTQEIISAHGVKNVHMVPSPIDLPARTAPAGARERLAKFHHIGYRKVARLWGNSRHFQMGRGQDQENMQSRMSATLDLAKAVDQGLLFLSILNPNDMRKNIPSLIVGFSGFQSAHPDAALIIKLNLPPERTTTAMAIDAILRKLPHPIAIRSPNIFLLIGYLDADELVSLYRASSFYLSTTLAEGQNLPLQEAMSQGVLAIAPRHTAMVDYIDDGGAVIIPHEMSPFPFPSVAANHARAPFEVAHSKPIDVARALCSAVALDPQRRLDLANRGRKTVTELYSVAAVAAKIQERLAVAESAHAELAA
jgi:glycosyltransferase involved in cell wall biosynthesis